MRKILIKFFIILMFLLIITFASSFKGQDYNGFNFPYKGALFLHDGDFVEFYCDSNHSVFYYLTFKSGNCPVEVMERKNDGSWKSIKTIILPPKMYSNNVNLNNLSFLGFFDLANVPGCLNKRIGIHLRENRTIGGNYYGDKDLFIMLKDGTNVYLWKGVDSYEAFDLDGRARKEDKWIEYANSLVDKRIATINNMINTFIEISSLNETSEAMKSALGNLLNGISSSYFPPDHLSLAKDYCINIATEYLSLYSQWAISMTRSLNYVVCGALGDVYSGAFQGLQYVQWMQNILSKTIPQSILTVNEAYDRTLRFKSFVGRIRTASSSQLDNLKQYLLKEKEARQIKNKENLRNTLISQLSLLHSSSCDNNPLFTNDQDISKGEGLSLWHIYAKACSIAKSRENDPNYPKGERQAYSMLRILTEKLMATILNLYLETLWVKNAEEVSYLLRG